MVGTDAIFVDFEALQEPPIPAVLGVLRVLASRSTFEQVVVEPRLSAAAAAQQHVRAADLESSLEAVLKTDLPIVGWSYFDRDLVSSLPIQPSIKQRWAERYVNALATARTWRTRVHPTFKIARAGPFAARHTLDQYAALAAYPHVRQFQGATPAKWIRHLIKQMASGKHYSRVTAEAKRDWRKLLEYNRHDCFALRHVYEKATRELQAWEAYERTTYCVEDGARRVCFRIGSTSKALEALLKRQGANRWALLTAWNPASQRLSRAENDRSQTNLVEELMAAGYRCLRGEGRGTDPSWPPEESVLALDIPKRIARRLGRKFGQLAIVTGHRGFPSRLVACS